MRGTKLLMPQIVHVDSKASSLVIGITGIRSPKSAWYDVESSKALGFVLADILRRFGLTKATAFLFLITFSLPSLRAQQPTFRTEMFHGRHAYVLENGLIRVS